MADLDLDFELDPDLEDFQPPAKKRAKNVKNHFGKPTSEEEIATLAKGLYRKTRRRTTLGR